MSRANVFSIEEFSVFDGPGIRTTVFLMGCPLRCEWCHNPEGQGFENFILRSENGCTHCGRCQSEARSIGGRTVYTEESLRACPVGLLRYCAKEYSAEELCRVLKKNVPILNASGGGVTFSGGEPMASGEFLLECLTRLRGVTHRAVQTSGYAEASVFSEVLAACDFMLYDLKLVDDALHRRYTGRSNLCILENFKTLAASGKAFVVRVPLIPTVTDRKENIEGIARLLKENGVRSVELLPYNKMAGAKYKMVGMKYTPSFDEAVPVLPRCEILAEYGIKSKII